MGTPFERRGARFDDYLAAVKKVWSGEVVEHDGEFLSWHGFKSYPTPVQKAPPADPDRRNHDQDPATRRRRRRRLVRAERFAAELIEKITELKEMGRPGGAAIRVDRHHDELAHREARRMRCPSSRSSGSTEPSCYWARRESRDPRKAIDLIASRAGL